MYTGTQARDWTALHAQGATAVQRAEAGYPWEQAGPRTSGDQETWLISFIDVLTLLLTLFVLLLAYQKHEDAHEPAQRTPVVAQQIFTESAAPSVNPPIVAASVLADTAVAPSAQPDRPTDIDADPAAEVTAESARMTTRAAAVEQEPFSLAAVYFMDRALEPVPDSRMTAAEMSPPLWLDATPVAQPAVEQAAGIGSTEEPAVDPKQRLLADLERSALAGRVEVSVLPDAVNLEISDNILFTPASAALTTGGRDLLDELATTLKTLPYALSVEGHTDDVPIRTARYPSNWELAAARASTVTRHLIEQGVAAERVRAIGYADTRPRAENTTPEGRARNRRVSFILRMPVS